MPVHKQDAQKALRLLQHFSNALKEQNDPELQRSLEDLIRVFKSKLFVALVELQDFYHESLLDGSKSAVEKLQDASQLTASRFRSDGASPQPVSGGASRHQSLGSIGSLYSEDSRGAAPGTQRAQSSPSQLRNSEDARGVRQPSAPSSGSSPLQRQQSSPQTDPQGTARRASAQQQPQPQAAKRDVYDLEWEHEYDVGSLTPESARNVRLMDEIEVIDLPHSSTGLGLNINGGTDKMYLPGDPSIYITAVIPGRTAERDGRIQVGDRIVSVNGVSLENVTHAEAVQTLRHPSPGFRITVQHGAFQRRKSEVAAASSSASAELQTHIIEVALQRGPNGLGFSIAGGVGSPHVSGDTGIFITKIIPDGVADADGRLAIGDKILEINGHSCVGKDHDTVVSYLLEECSVLRMKVEQNAFYKSADEAAAALGLKQAPEPKFSRTGTLKRFATGEKSTAQSSSGKMNENPIRSVVLERGTTGYGFNIVGPTKSGPSEAGEPVGVFISKITKGGAADKNGRIMEGDQILTLNGQDLRFASYTEAASLIKSAQRDTMALDLQQNVDVYNLFLEKIAALKRQVSEDKLLRQAKNTFHVRALFDYNPASDTKLTAKERELSPLEIKVGDVFLVSSVTDPQWWTVQALSNGRAGVIPSRLRRDMMEKQRLAASPQKAKRGDSDEDISKGSQGIRKRSKSFRIARRLSFRKKKSKSSLDEDTDSTDSVNAATGTPLSYERVELRAQSADAARPLIILGPSKDAITDQLVTDFPDLFGSCVPHTTRAPRDGEVEGEDYYFVTHEQMQVDMRNGLFIEAGQYNGNLYGTSVSAVRQVSAEGQTCILDVSAHAIARLKQAEIIPIAIFLKPRSVDVIKQQNTHYTSEMAQTVMDLALQVESEFRHQFSAVLLNESFERTYQEVVEIIRKESRDPYWAISSLALP